MFRKTIITLAILAATLTVAWYGCRYYVQSLYPYGWSHCCDIGLSFALQEFARKHNGFFPNGESSPEASLSLLYKDGSADPNLLRGKSIPESVVSEILESGRLLGPETCGWHYIEGLTLADDSRLAIFWDKAGLNHNGMLLSGGGHIVYFLNGIHEHITADKWPQFLEEQKRLHAARSKRAIKAIPWLNAKIRLPSGEVVEEYFGQYELEMDPGGRTSGRSLRPSNLHWWNPPFGSDQVTLTLTLDDLESKPLKVKCSEDRAETQSIIFEMFHKSSAAGL